MPATYVNIATTTLGSNQATVTFSSIPQTYTDLVIRWSARHGDAFGSGAAQITFNGSTSSEYSFTWLRGNGTAAQSSNNSNRSNIEISNAAANTTSSTTNTFSNNEIYIPNYTVSQNKPVYSYGVREENATDAFIMTQANLWRNTAAITSISITASSSNFASGSTFYLYGIKNS